MIVFKAGNGVKEDVILGTYGEAIIIRGLKLVVNDIEGSAFKERDEAIRLLEHLGIEYKHMFSV